MPLRHSNIREAACAANRLLPRFGLVDITFGNVSVLDRQAGVFAIKPSGVDYEALTPADMVLVDMHGKKIEGALNPSSDTPTHARLYQVFGDAGAVVHTHSRHATAFAQAGKPIPCFGTTHADYFHGEVPVTRSMSAEEIAEAYEWETGNVIAECFATLDPKAIPAVLVRHHGPFVWGPTGEKAVETALALEICAQMAREALSLNPSLRPIPSSLHDKHFLRKHGKTAYYGQKA